MTRRAVCRRAKRRAAELPPREKNFVYKQSVRAFAAQFRDGPDANAIIDPAGDDAFAVRAERDGVLVFFRLAERVEPFTGGHVPDFHRAVPAGTGEDFPGGMKRQIVNRPVVPVELPQLFPFGDVPQFDLPVVTSRRQQPPLRADGNGVQAVGVPFQPGDGFPGAGIPDGCFTPNSRFATRGGEEFSIGRDGQIVSPHRRVPSTSSAACSFLHRGFPPRDAGQRPASCLWGKR